jgi:phosphoesterase RecJ-like protein
MGKDVVPISTDGVPETLRWMPGAPLVCTETDRRGFDLGIVCDTGTYKRVGRALPALESAGTVLCIDHHLTEGTCGDIRVVDAKAAATGELVYALLKRMNVGILPEVAECLMCALVTDTGAFRFLNVTPTTFRISAELMRLGASPARVAEQVFENRSLASIKVLGRALDSLQTTAEGRIAWAVVRAQDFGDFDAEDTDTEGVVNHIRAVDTAVVGVLFREVPGQKVRVSLRSRDGYDVSKVAEAFGGGGHRLAAGCHVEGPLASAEAKVLAEVEKWLPTETAG